MLNVSNGLHAPTKLRPVSDGQTIGFRTNVRRSRCLAPGNSGTTRYARGAAAPTGCNTGAAARHIVPASTGTAAADVPMTAAELQGILSYTPGNVLGSGMERKAVGCMLGAMCGNALGAPVQNDRHWQIMRLHPYGLTEIPVIDMSDKPVPRGGVTGEYMLLLAMARSLVQAGTCDAQHQALVMVTHCDPDARRYTPYAELFLQAMRTGSSRITDLPRLASVFLKGASCSMSTSSARPEREPFGVADFGAAARIPPVALAYRDAPQELLRAAVEEACLASHSHALGREGAHVVAAALQWLLHRQATNEGQGNDAAATPQQLLKHLQGVARTSDMQSRLQVLQDNLLQLGSVSNWVQLFKSKPWNQIVQVHSRLTLQDQATLGTEAAVVALWALCTSWEQPRQAVSVAATLGGSTSVTAQLTGAMAGALHGDAWIPASWWGLLENSHVASMRSSAKGSSTVPDPAENEAREGWQEGDNGLMLRGLRDEALFLAHALLQLSPKGVGFTQEESEGHDT